jgi:hypothetical protein
MERLATRLQDPLFVSPYLASLIEDLVYSEVKKMFSNQGMPTEIFFLRSKEKVEVDFLSQLPNHRYVALEVKSTPVDFTAQQLCLLETLELDILERWVVSLVRSSVRFQNSKSVAIADLYESLKKLWDA